MAASPPPEGVGERIPVSQLLGWSLNRFLFTGHSGSGAGSSDPEQGPVSPEIGGPARGKGAPWYAPQLQKATALFVFCFPDGWTHAVPLTLHFPSPNSALGPN